MKNKELSYTRYSFDVLLIILLIILSLSISVSATSVTYLNDTFDRSDSNDIGINWTGYKTEHKISNNYLVRNGVATNAGILVNTTLMPLNASGYVVEIEGNRPTTLVYFQNMSGKGYGYSISVGDDANRKIYLWKVSGTTSTLINNYFTETNSWSTATKITVVAVTNQAKFLVFKDGVYDGYLEDASNTYTSGYCGIGEKGNGAVEAESFKCYGYTRPYFDDSTGYGYIVDGEYNLTNGQTYNNLTALRTGTLNITNANIKINTNNGNNIRFLSKGGNITLENASVSPTDSNNWSQIYLTTENVYIVQNGLKWPSLKINNSTFESMGKPNAGVGEHAPSTISLEYAETGSYITNTTFNNSAEIAVQYSSRPTRIDNNIFQNPRTFNTQILYINQISNLAITNNQLIGNYTLRNVRIGAYLASVSLINFSYNKVFGVYDYGVDFNGCCFDQITYIGNYHQDSQKGLVFNHLLTNSLIKDNIFYTTNSAAQSSISGYTGFGDNVSVINNTLYSDTSIADGGFKPTNFGINTNVTGFINTGLHSSLARLSGDNGMSAFIVNDGTNGTINDVLIDAVIYRAVSGMTFEKISNTKNINIIATNITVKNVAYGIHAYSCENCTLRDLDVSGSIADIKLETDIRDIFLINNKKSNIVFVNPLTKANNFNYADILVQTQNNIPIYNAEILVYNKINNLYPSINRNGNAKTTFTIGVDGHTPLPRGNDSDTPVLMSHWQNSTTRQNMSYLISVFDPSHLYTSTPTLIFPNGTLLSLSPLATATVSPNESWYRPNPNTYQNTTVITIDRARTYHKLKFPNGSITVTDANQTLLTATSAAGQSYILFNNTIPGFYNKSVTFMVDNVIYANQTANESGFVSFNYTSLISSGSSHTFKWLSNTSSSGVDGDLNDDGIVDEKDVDIVNQHMWNVTSSPYPNYDVNQDGIVDILDMQFVMGKIPDNLIDQVAAFLKSLVSNIF